MASPAGRANFNEQSLAWRIGTRVHVRVSLSAGKAASGESSRESSCRATSTTVPLKSLPWSNTVSLGRTGSEAQNTCGAARALLCIRLMNNAISKHVKEDRIDRSLIVVFPSHSWDQMFENL